MALAIDAVRLKKSVGYDESISYLVATCHQESYSEISFDVVPRPGSHWNRFVREVEQPFCFDKIARGLGRHDIHPPLYFWLLHLWLLLFGTHLWSGPLLNIVLTLFTAVILIRFADQVLHDRGEKLLMILTFALNPSVLLVSLEVRQYTLMGLWALLFAWQTIRYADDPSRRVRLVQIGVLIVLGLLTHYQFLIVVLGGVLFVTATLLRTKRRKIGWFLLCSALACLVAYAIHSHFFDSLQRQLSANPDRSFVDWLNRLNNAFTALITYSYLVPALIMSLAVCWQEARRRKKTITEHLAEVDRSGAAIVYFALWTTGAIVAQHLAFFSPAHALGPPKYLSIAWPFLPILAVYILRIANNRKSLLLYLSAIPILLSVLFPFGMRIYSASDMSPIRAQGGLVVVDNTARGIFLQVAWFLPDDLPVIVDMQEELIDNADRWLPYLKEGATYISDTSDPGARLRQRRLVATLQDAGYVVEPLDETVGSKSTRFDAFRVRPNAAGE